MSNNYSALILDCDGVIVDSEPISCYAWNIVFKKEYGIDIGTDYSAILGTNLQFAANFYLQKYNLPTNDEIINRLGRIKDHTYLETAKGKLKTITGVEKVISQARKLGWKVAVASSGSIKKIMFNLQQVGLENHFDIISGSVDGIRGKPYPDIFLQAAKKLNIDVKKCLAIEDTPNGILAAKRAGMYVIAITTSLPPHRLSKADRIINSFAELDLAQL